MFDHLPEARRRLFEAVDAIGAESLAEREAARERDARMFESQFPR